MFFQNSIQDLVKASKKIAESSNALSSFEEEIKAELILKDKKIRRTALLKVFYVGTLLNLAEK